MVGGELNSDFLDAARPDPGQAPPGSIICPSCQDVYDTRDKVRGILANSGYCTNITCLQDLSAFPFDLARDTTILRRHP